MKKIILWSISFLFLVIIFISSYLSLVGYETNKFNSLLENKITSNVSNTEINLNKIKIKIDVQNMSFFITTLKPNIKYYEKNVNISKIDAYINLKSLLIGKPKIDKINIESNEIEVDEIKDIVKYQKHQILKSFS